MPYTTKVPDIPFSTGRKTLFTLAMQAIAVQ
jgi:hypothetical protein